MSWENHRRNKAQGVVIDPEVRGAHTIDDEDIIAVLVLDETDWENKAFRYYL